MTEQTTSQQPQAPQPSNDLAIGSMILGLISFTGFGLLTGLPAIIMGVIALKRPGGRGYSITGIITGSITTALTLLAIIAFIVLIAIGFSLQDSNGGVDIEREPYQQETFIPGTT